MPNKYVENLEKLSRRERQVLELRCIPLQYKEIVQRLDKISLSSVKEYMGRIYVKLGLDILSIRDRQEAIFEIYCPLLKTTEPPEAAEFEIIEPVPDDVMDEVEKDEVALVPWTPRQQQVQQRPTPPIIIPPPPPASPSPEKKANSLMPVVVTLGLALVGVIVFIAAQSGRQAGNVNFTPPTAVVVLPSPTVQVAAPQPTSAQPRVIVVTATPNAVVQPTTAPQPTAPQATPLPSVGLPFRDNFDQGIRPEWRVVTGKPVVVNGRLAAGSDEILLEIGDNTWTNYTVDFDVSFTNYDYLHLIIARELRYEIYTRVGTWSALQNNYWSKIADGVGTDTLESRHVRLVVAGNTSTVSIAGKPDTSVTYPISKPGPLGLWLRLSASVDNLTITNP